MFSDRIKELRVSLGINQVEFGKMITVSKHITTPLRADIVYFLMKPLEWAFVGFLYLFDVQPEKRISRQYKYCGK